MHRDFIRPVCWTDTPTERVGWTASDSRWCRAWPTRTEMMLYQPGCAGCARAPHTHDPDFAGTEYA